MGPPRVPTYYNFAWVPHTFGGLTPPDPPLFRTLKPCNFLKGFEGFI